MPTKSTRSRSRFSVLPWRVVVHFAVPRRGTPSAASLRRWARAADPAMDVTLRIVAAPEGKRLNKKFRRKNRATNVLSFSYGGEGDVVLCHPVIAREARAQGKSGAAHYAHLVVHGVLHLRGDEHATSKQATRMNSTQTSSLALIPLAHPYTLNSTPS